MIKIKPIYRGYGPTKLDKNILPLEVALILDKLKIFLI